MTRNPARRQARLGLVAATVALACVCMAAAIPQAQGWTTGDTAPVKTLQGASTRLTDAEAIAFDARGRMYVANRAQSRITVYAPNWASGNSAPVKTLEGAATGLDGPRGLAFDYAGRLFVANSSNSVTVYAEDFASGNTPPIGTIAGASTGLALPLAIAIDSLDRLFVANSWGPTITVYVGGFAGGNLTPIKTLQGPSTGLATPTGIAFDAEGQMFVANMGGSITAYNQNWPGGDFAPFKTLSGESTGLASPFRVAFDPAGRMYVTNTTGASVTVYDTDWASGNTAPIKTLSGAATGLSSPAGLAFDAIGRMYVGNGTSTVTAYAPDDYAPSFGTISVSPGLTARRPSRASVTGMKGWPIASLSYQWESASSADGPWSPIAGAAGPVLVPSVSLFGQFVRVKVTAGNGIQPVAVAYSSAQAVSNSQPSITAVSPTSGSVIARTRLTIEGDGFVAGKTVVGLTTGSAGGGCVDVVVISATRLTCKTEQIGLGTYAVEVYVTGTQALSARKANAFTMWMPTPPGVPGNVESSVRGRTVTISWTRAQASTSPVTGYVASCVWSGGKKQATVGPGARKAALDLPRGFWHTCSVWAKSSAGPSLPSMGVMAYVP